MIPDPEQLLERYGTLTGWSEALMDAGARAASVIQQFSRNVRLTRNGVHYIFARDAIASVRQLDSDVVHVNGFIFPIRTWRVRQRVDSPTAVVAQNHSDTGPLGCAPGLRIFGRAARRGVDAFLVAAEEHAARWRTVGLIGPHQRVYQVMEGSTVIAPVPERAARVRTRIGGTPAVLWVGRLNDNKDPATVLSAFERAVAFLPDATLTMLYTENNLLGRVRQQIDRSPVLTDRVRLVGAVPHHVVNDYYSAADVFILGSHHEGSGYALIEALACGLTPAVTNIPTFRLLTADGSIGCLWMVGDVESCMHAIVAANEQRTRITRSMIRDYFWRKWSWPAIGRRAMEIYDDVCAARRARLVS